MKENFNTLKKRSSSKESNNNNCLFNLFNNSPIPSDEMLDNLGLFTNRQLFTKFLFFNEIYKMFLNTNGIIIEFGVRWGQNLALLEILRGIYEPYNYTRKIVGFDTFEGFKSIDEKDGTHKVINNGSYNVSENYINFLEKVLEYHEQNNPINHIKKIELIKGDATKTIHKFLNKNPQTIISFAYFDFDIYNPTKECLEAIKPFLNKGSILAFDQLNHKVYPGETLALKEVFGLNRYKINRFQYGSYPSYLVIE